MAPKRSVLAVLVFGLPVAVWGFKGWFCAAQPLQVAGANQIGLVQKVKLPIKIPIIIVKYFPVDGEKIDIKITGDWDDSLAATRAKTERITQQTIQALEEGSRYHGYKDKSAKPSLAYEILNVREFLQPLPVRPNRPENKVPMTDYAKIMTEIDIQAWVEQKGVREVWLFGYHGNVAGLWESNMSSPHGDVSNSDRDPNDLPVLSRTYTVYHYNYQRDVGEAVENHAHQIEHLLNYVDGRDTTPTEKWPDLLFWGKFVGSDISHKMVPVRTPDGRQVYRCGWTHYAPNSERDYDWANKRAVETDIENWQPDGIGGSAGAIDDRWVYSRPTTLRNPIFSMAGSQNANSNQPHF
jgi:hypothetical protein